MLFYLLWVFFFAVGNPQTDHHSGSKIVLRYTANNHTSEFTSYTMGDRRRMESRNSIQYRNADGVLVNKDPIPNVSIVRCDLGQSFDLNTHKGEYTLEAYPPDESGSKERAAEGQSETTDAEVPITLRIEITTVDTGEREEIYGHEARHVVTTLRQIHLNGSHQEPEVFATDGWYIDFDRRISCDTIRREETKNHGYARGVLGKSLSPERYEYVYIGARERGLAVKEVETPKSTAAPSTNASGSTYESEVTEFVEGPLDAILFEVPSEFKRVERLQ
jgi:hypothetical protein